MREGELQVENEWWQITEFAEKISNWMKERFNDENASVHYNTVDKWFKALESKRIHYINRAAGEKVYDRLDFEIGCFIAEARRGNKFRLDVIFENVARNFETRPFPDDFESEAVTIDETLLQNRIMENIEKFLTKQFSIQETKLEHQLRELINNQIHEHIQKMLPEPVNKEEERARRINDHLTKIKIEQKLEEEAIREWNQLPEGDRLKKVGFFRKEEDLLKRENFIREYKKKHLERAFKEEYDIE